MFIVFSKNLQNIPFHLWGHEYINLKEIIKILNKQYRYWKKIFHELFLYRYFPPHRSFIIHCPSIERFTFNPVIATSEKWRNTNASQGCIFTRKHGISLDVRTSVVSQRILRIMVVPFTTFVLSSYETSFSQLIYSSF